MRSATSSFLAPGSFDAGYTLMHAMGKRMTNGPVDASQEHPSYSRDSKIPTAPPVSSSITRDGRSEGKMHKTGVRR